SSDDEVFVAGGLPIPLRLGWQWPRPAADPDAAPKTRGELIVLPLASGVLRVAGMRPAFVPPMLRGPIEALASGLGELLRVTTGVRSMRGWAAAWEAEAERHAGEDDAWRAATAYYIAGRALLRPTPLRAHLYELAIHWYCRTPHAVPLERFAVQVG